MYTWLEQKDTLVVTWREIYPLLSNFLYSFDIFHWKSEISRAFRFNSSHFNASYELQSHRGEEGMKGPALNNNYHGNYDKPSFRVPFLHPSRAFLSDYYLHSLLLHLCFPLLFFLFFLFFFFIPPPGHGIPAFPPPLILLLSRFNCDLSQARARS